MNPTTLAANANVALYSAMVVYTLAMLAFTWHLAARVPKDTAVRVPEREHVLVGAGAPVSDGAPEVVAAGSGSAPVAGESVRSRQRGNIALMLTYLATALLSARC